MREESKPKTVKNRGLYFTLSPFQGKEAGKIARGSFTTPNLYKRYKIGETSVTQLRKGGGNFMIKRVKYKPQCKKTNI